MFKRLLIVLFLSTINGVCFAKTANDLITDARLMARDPSYSGRVRFTNAQILDFLNEAQKDVMSETLCIRKEYTFVSVQDTQYYALPSDYITADRVLSANDRLEEKTPAKLDIQSDSWETTKGTPTDFFINFSSRTKIGLYPYPDVGTDTTTIKVEYYAQVYDLGTSSTPFNSITEFTPYQPMLAYYAAAQMLYIDGMSGAADRYMQRYLAWRISLKNYCRARPGYTPGINTSNSTQ